MKNAFTSILLLSVVGLAVLLAGAFYFGAPLFGWIIMIAIFAVFIVEQALALKKLSLVEQVAAYGGGDERGPVVVDTVAFVQPEFCTQEQGVHLGHVLVAHIADAIAFLGALRIPQTTAERHGLQSQLLFQFHEFIPLRHGGFLTSANERIDGVLAETCSAVAMNITQAVEEVKK